MLYNILTKGEKKGVLRESYGLNFYSLLTKHLGHRSQLKRLIGQDQLLWCVKMSFRAWEETAPDKAARCFMRWSSLWWWEMRISPMPIWKRDGVRKATEFTEDVHVVSVVQDPPKAERMEREGQISCLWNSIQKQWGLQWERSKVCENGRDKAQKRRQHEDDGVFFTKSAQCLKASKKVRVVWLYVLSGRSWQSGYSSTWLSLPEAKLEILCVA